MVPEQIKAAGEKYEAVIAKSLQKFPERHKDFKTVSGAPLERLYLPDTETVEKYTEKLGYPGQYPFTRGVQPTMYRGRFWTMRQYAGFSTAEESNKRYRYLLANGSTGLSVAFDLPTQIGLDSDNDMCVGEVGKVGVAIDTLADMETLFDGIPLDKVSTSMTINAPAAVLLAMYIAVGEKQGVSADKLEGTIQNDVLKEYVARGTYIFPPKPSLRIIANIFEYCTRNVPKWNTISISGYHIREAGSTAAQEVGFTLADAICYIDTALKAGLKLEEFAPRLAFFFAAHTDVLEEVAKFRAARRLYAKIIKERFKCNDAKSQMLRFHTQTGGVTLTAQQPDNNVVRVALQALSAVLGGTQSLHTNSKDEALALPTEDSVRLALRTQQIIAHESGVANTVDPLAGSFVIEALTDRIEAEAADIIKKIDDMGGVVPAIENGFIAQAIERSGYEYNMSVEKKERIVVGVNDFIAKESGKFELFEVPEAIRAQQVGKLTKTKANRNNAKVTAALEALKVASKGEANLMPFILDAVREYASIGEICDVLRTTFGEYQESYSM